MYQAVSEGDIETLKDLHSSGDYPDLSQPDGVGNTPAHLAVLFDRPEVLKFLHAKGVDLGRKCDATNFGTPAFYCMHYGKTQMLSDLWSMGYDLSEPCDKWGMPPLYYAEKKGDKLIVEHLKELISRGTLQDVMATIIQRVTRGLFSRNIYREMVKERDRLSLAQTMIAAPWRGGVVRMRDHKRRKDEAERAVQEGEKGAPQQEQNSEQGDQEEKKKEEDVEGE